MISIVLILNLISIAVANICPNSTLEQRSTKEYSYGIAGVTNPVFYGTFTDGISSYFMGSFQNSSGSPGTQTIIMKTDLGLSPVEAQTYGVTPQIASFAAESDLSSFYFQDRTVPNIYEISGSDFSVMKSYTFTSIAFYDG